uniref:ubiquitinyl hydrolase 1 n=1 Tax=Panagrellus redivivus TaxID=6233 RepID=A0A7E4W9I2_PANRE
MPPENDNRNRELEYAKYKENHIRIRRKITNVALFLAILYIIFIAARSLYIQNPSVGPSSTVDKTGNEDGSGFANEELERRFAERLQNVRGLGKIEVAGDGACMFRAVAKQVFGTDDRHMEVRQHCIEYISRNRDHFSQFITEDFEAYIARKKDPSSHGNHVELQAISEIYGRQIEIYEYDTKPVITFHPITVDANVVGEHPPLMLSYHGNVHYNCVADIAHPINAPIVPIYPNLSTNMHDEVVYKDAVQKSEMTHIEEQMLNDKKKMTDFEGTEQDLIQQVARDSYMDYIQFLENSQKCEAKKDRTIRKKSPEVAPSTVAAPTVSAETPASSSNVASTNLPSTSRSPTKRGASYPSLFSENDEDDVFGCKIPRNSASTISLPAMGSNMKRENIDVSTFTWNVPSEKVPKPKSPVKESTPASTTVKPSTAASAPKFQAMSRNPSIVDLPPLNLDATIPPAPVSLNAPQGTSSLYEELLASTLFDDEKDSLSHALAISQQEYYKSSR